MLNTYFAIISALLWQKNCIIIKLEIFNKGIQISISKKNLVGVII